MASLNPTLREFFTEGAVVAFMGEDANERAYGHLAAKAAETRPVHVIVSDSFGAMRTEIEARAAYPSDHDVARESLMILGVPSRDQAALLALGTRIDLTELPSLDRDRTNDNTFKM
jgi:hypothetical protein